MLARISALAVLVLLTVTDSLMDKHANVMKLTSTTPRLISAYALPPQLLSRANVLSAQVSRIKIAQAL